MHTKEGPSHCLLEIPPYFFPRSNPLLLPGLLEKLKIREGVTTFQAALFLFKVAAASPCCLWH